MSTEIEAKEITIVKLFSSDFMFKIPIYQRPLSWEGDNFEQLFEDIFDAMDNKEAQYFLGSIVLQEHEHERNEYYIVDGQQRISALAILMAVIRDFTDISSLNQSLASCLYQAEDKYKKIPAEWRITPWEDLKEKFKKYIYEPGGTQKFMDDFNNKLIKYRNTQDPQYHLYEAISVFIQKVKLYDSTTLENFVIYFLNQVYLVYIKTPTLTSAFRLFNVLNTRGLQLSTSDLLKSENIGVIQDESTRSHYAKIWRDIENNLGREELENVITFIRTIKLKEKAKSSIYEEYQKIFNKGFLRRGGEFINYLNEMADIYTDKILEGEIQEEAPRGKNEYKNIVALLKKFVPFSDWIPPLIIFCYKFKKDQCLLDFILKLEKKVIVEWAAKFSPTERITSFNRIIKLIENEKEAQKVVDELLSHKGEEGSTPISTGILNFSDKNQIESILMDKLNDNQFYSIYGGKFAKLVLLRIDMEYWDLESFPGYQGTITVEHILPQTPSKDSEWAKTFNEEEREKWTNKLGNLVLLSGSKNSKAQNYNFKKKKEVYFKKKMTPFRITQWLENKDKWTLEELNERHYKLLNKAKEIFLNY